jgi:hypothetical protein
MTGTLKGSDDSDSSGDNDRSELVMTMTTLTKGQQ